MNPRGLALFVTLLLCSCATEPPGRNPLPPTMAMNPDAGRGGLLTLEVRLANGAKIPLILDTGSPTTAFETSLAPLLGERLGSNTMVNFGVPQTAGMYRAPALWLGRVPLQMTGPWVATFDRHQMADHGWPALSGFLGMDVLQHYCVQLDFTAGQVRFLDDTRGDPSRWGTPFPLTDLGDGCCTIPANLAGVTNQASVVDTGCDCSGWLSPALYRQWTNQASSADEKIYAPDGTLGGAKYHDLYLRPPVDPTPTNDDHLQFNGVGLRALAQNLVTLDFPRHTLYLLHTNDWPLASPELAAALKSAAKSSLKTVEHLLYRGQLPGIPRDSHGNTSAFHFHHDDTPWRDTATWDLLKNGDPASYHYTFSRSAKQAPWKLQKAWRSDENGRTLDEYPLPK